MAVDEFVLHSATQEQIKQLILHPPHAIGLVGATGMGKKSIAASLCAELLGVPLDKLNAYPYVRHFEPTKNSISIEVAREINEFTKLKTTGTNTIRRVVVINDAHTMTIEAQNAMLKTLEEPPADTVFILTIASIADLLPTVVSRLSITHVVTPSADELQAYFAAQGYDVPTITTYFMMSGGLPGLMASLLAENDSHSMVASVGQAKHLLTSDTFERLVAIDEIVKNKQTNDVIQALCQISRSAMYIEATKEQSSSRVLKKWAKILAASESAKQNMRQNGQAKLVLTDLFLHI